MATYTNGNGDVVLCTHHDTPYEAVGGSTHSVRCTDGTGEMLGFLDYDVGGGSLCVHTLSAGGGRGIGTILMFEAAVQAPLHGKQRVSAVAVAREAYGFYLKAGLHPDADAPVDDLEFEAQLMIGRMMRGSWSSSIEIVRNVCFESLSANWAIS